MFGSFSYFHGFLSNSVIWFMHLLIGERGRKYSSLSVSDSIVSLDVVSLLIVPCFEVTGQGYLTGDFSSTAISGIWKSGNQLRLVRLLSIGVIQVLCVSLNRGNIFECITSHQHIDVAICSCWRVLVTALQKKEEWLK